ncbi:competence protein ComEA helix-hairpin-helix repeat protein [Paenibacillus sp. JCM 10914]|nr:competence protein ComEA helix-hairpin-helix repeat protein [Paenibacillus sp. JCM 10914]
MGMKGDERAAEVVNELPDLAVSPVNATLPMAEAASAESASDRAADGPDKHEESPVQAAPESRPVPTEPESSPATDVAETEDQSGLINVNTADAQTLMELPGIGEAKAKAIINHRTQFGPYRSVADLLEVKGIGPKMLEKMKPYVGL